MQKQAKDGFSSAASPLQSPVMQELLRLFWKNVANEKRRKLHNRWM